MSISVIIPTYREPEYLDLCLKSCTEGQVNENEIIVVCDGYYNENKDVLKNYKNVNLLNLEQNVGLPKSTNLGVYNASKEWILIVNDDNVFPKEWDKKLEGWIYTEKNEKVISPNQIEPTPSIFKDFIIKDCGIDPNTFDLDNFWEISKKYNKNERYNYKGGTLPIFMKKKDYLRVGGWDENYPTSGVVADWDFFHKCRLSGMDLVRDYNTHFYHFVSKATIPTQEQLQKRQQDEYNGHEWGKYKWNEYLKHNLLHWHVS